MIRYTTSKVNSPLTTKKHSEILPTKNIPKTYKSKNLRYICALIHKKEH